MKEVRIDKVNKRLINLKCIASNLNDDSGTQAWLIDRLNGILNRLPEYIEILSESEFSKEWKNAIKKVENELSLTEKLVEYLCEINQLSDRLSETKKRNQPSSNKDFQSLLELTEEAIASLKIVVYNYEQSMLTKGGKHFSETHNLKRENQDLSSQLKTKLTHAKNKGNTSRYEAHEATIIDEIEKFLNSSRRKKVLKKDLRLNIVQAIHGENTNEIPPSQSAVDGWLKIYEESKDTTIFRFKLK